MVDRNLIAKLDRCLLSGKTILFTGAGFSYGAKNGLDQDLPLGKGLKTLLLTELLGFNETDPEYQELMEESLSDVCSYVERESSPAKVQDYIIEKFSDCKPLDYHKKIARFGKWKKIYTVNIDDLLENATDTPFFAVQDVERPITYTKAKQVEYIKLHGSVRNRSSRLVFSNTQYVDSMLKSTDYRFNSFSQDMQMENFVIVGTEMDEINLDYYLNLFSAGSWKTAHGQLFFINPKPRIAFKSKVASIGASIIEWTTEQFADHLEEIGGGAPKGDCDIDGFLTVRKKYDIDKQFKGYKSELYFGKSPEYRDIIFDWDFLHPEIADIRDILVGYLSKGSGKKLLIALYGKSLSGKSVYLKRLGIELVQENFAVYERTGLDFDISNLILKVRNTKEQNIAILIENASFYYPDIKYLINKFPLDKNIVVVTTARTIYHHKKRYSLVSEPWYKEYPITGEIVSQNDYFAKNIEQHLDEKGLLGKLKAKTKEERIKYISGFHDVESCLFSITNGSHFQKRQLSIYYKDKEKNSLGVYYNLLSQLAIFKKLDLPYLPLEVVSLMYGADYERALSSCDNYIALHRDVNGISLRDSFLLPHIFKNMRGTKKISLLKDILVVISPQVVDSNHNYWNEMASTLMKGKLLRSMLKMTNGEVKNLLTDIKNYYNDDYNYWLQVGISEQHDSEYELALNHFRQAESMSPNSYIVRNAIARNFLRQANEESDFDLAKKLHEEGCSLMNKLIDECEEFQVKAYSTHCLLFEKVRFYRRNSIIPSDSIIRSMYEQLKRIIDKDPEGPMSKHISNVFFKFIKDNKLTKVLPSLTLYDLKYFKPLVEDDTDIKSAVLEDFELE